MIFLVVTIISAFICACRGKVFIGLKWLRRLLITERLWKVSGIPWCVGIFVHLRSRRFLNNLVSIFFNTIYCQPVPLIRWKSKGSHGGSWWRKVLFRRGFNQAPLRYIRNDEIAGFSKKSTLEIVASIRGAVDSSNRLSFSWPTMEGPLIYYWPPWKLMLCPSLVNAKHVSFKIWNPRSIYWTA